jgi:hypothetical protein
MSCLFNSFSALVGEPAQAIRGRICDWLATDPVLIDDVSASAVVLIESGLELVPYVARMRSASTWGGAIEIRAFVHLWQRPVKVLVLRTRKWIEFVGASGAECQISWSGGHYEPIRSAAPAAPAAAPAAAPVPGSASALMQRRRLVGGGRR